MPPAKKQKTSHSQTASDESPNKPSPTSTITTTAKETLELTLPQHKNPTYVNRYLPTPSSSRTSTPALLIFNPGASGNHNDAPTHAFCTGYSKSAECISFKGNLNLKARVKTLDALVEWSQSSVSTREAEHEDKVELKHEDSDGKGTKKREREIVVGGRSMGARAAVMVGGTHEEISRIVCVSYPLRGEKGDVRDGILLDLPREKEVLFVVGERDGMCDLEGLEEVRGRMEAGSWVVVVEGAGHGMDVGKGWAGDGVEGSEVVRREVGRVVAQWVRTGREWARRKTMRWNYERDEVELVDDESCKGIGRDGDAKVPEDKPGDNDKAVVDDRARPSRKRSQNKRVRETSPCTRQLRPRRAVRQ